METGAGFVFWVTLLVNVLIFPTTLEEKPCTPLTTEAAKSEPGRCGRLVLLEGLEEGMGDADTLGIPPLVRPKEGSKRPHHMGTKMGWVRNTSWVRWS